MKQVDGTGRPDIDAFEAMMTRENCMKGFFVSLDYSADAMSEIGRFFKQPKRVIVPLTVREILDEEIAHKLAWAFLKREVARVYQENSPIFQSGMGILPRLDLKKD